VRRAVAPLPAARRAAARVLAVGVTVLVVCLLALARWDAPTPAAEPATRTASPPVHHQQAAPARRVGSLVRPERPTAIRLPSGADVPVEAVSVTSDGELAVPGDVTRAGWWRGGSRVGDPFGSMLVAGHVDSSTQGLGRFAELLGVGPRARLRVTTRHLTQEFVVTARRLVPQGRLSRQRWIYAPTGRPRLTLVTCAPPYDRARGGYQNLAVLTALAATPAQRRPS
jgi:hypothetical protein